METYPPSKRYDLKFKADTGGIEGLTVPSNYSNSFQVCCITCQTIVDDTVSISTETKKKICKCKKKECREKGCAKGFLQLEEGHEQPYSTGEDVIAKRSVTIMHFHRMGFEPFGYVFQNDWIAKTKGERGFNGEAAYVFDTQDTFQAIN